MLTGVKLQKLRKSGITARVWQELYCKTGTTFAVGLQPYRRKSIIFAAFRNVVDTDCNIQCTAHCMIQSVSSTFPPYALRRRIPKDASASTDATRGLSLSPRPPLPSSPDVPIDARAKGFSAFAKDSGPLQRCRRIPWRERACPLIPAPSAGSISAARSKHSANVSDLASPPI